MRRRLSPAPLTGLGIILCLTLLLAACGSSTAQPAAPKDQVRLQLSWVHEYSSAPFYAAEKNGRFAAEGLDVTLLEGGFGEGGYIEPIDEVLSGNVAFGLASASSVIDARAAGKPIVAVASVLQRSPLAILTLADSGIMRPQDLVGRRITVAEGGATQSFQSLLAAQGIDPARVTTVPRTTYGIEPLLNGEVDGMVAWAINEGVQLREAGQEINTMLLSDYGVDTYDFLIITSEEMARQQPGLVQRFVSATLRGIEDVIANPEAAIDHTLAYAADLDRASQLRHLQASLPLIRPAGSRIGVMEPHVWALAFQTLGDSVAVQALDLEAAYTNSFVESFAASRK
jgi:NitT/TauT family transport system substrate-binding protein